MHHVGHPSPGFGLSALLHQRVISAHDACPQYGRPARGKHVKELLLELEKNLFIAL